MHVTLGVVALEQHGGGVVHQFHQTTTHFTPSPSHEHATRKTHIHDNPFSNIQGEGDGEGRGGKRTFIMLGTKLILGKFNRIRFKKSFTNNLSLTPQ